MPLHAIVTCHMRSGIESEKIFSPCALLYREEHFHLRMYSTLAASPLFALPLLLTPFAPRHGSPISHTYRVLRICVQFRN